MVTDRQLQRLPPGRHALDGGLYLRVSPKGKRVFLLRSRTGDTDRLTKLGDYPRMSLAEARRLASGVLPDITAAEAIETYVRKCGVADPAQVTALLSPLKDEHLTISRQELVSKLQKKAEKAPVHANRMLSRWKSFFDFCVQQGWLEDNPIAVVKRKFVGGTEKSRDRVLTEDEIAALPHPILWFILLTGLRPSEALYVLRAKDSITIPNKRTPRDGYLHALPHSHLIRWALNRNIPVPGDHRVMAHFLRRRGATYTPHDLRRTFATYLNEMGTPPYVVEKMLGHKMEGMLAVYNHAEYWPERASAQRKWGRRLIKLWRKKSPA